MPQSAIARGFLAQFSPARQADERADFLSISAVEAALEKQRDQLPLLVPVGLGMGIGLWQLAGDAALWPLALAAAGMAMIGAWAGLQYRLSQLVLWAALLLLLGFGAIALRSHNMAGERLEKPLVATMNARIESVEDVSARGIVRYVLETGKQAELPERVRVNLPLDQHSPEFAPGAIIRVKARLMPPPGPALPRSYDFARQAWFLGLGATGSTLSPPELIQPSAGSRAF
ncbi:MAG: hypothetical protein RL481_1314, partial [Pseudomonadota bacterium]